MGWQVTLCNPIWLGTLRSSVRGLIFLRAIHHRYLFLPFEYPPIILSTRIRTVHEPLGRTKHSDDARWTAAWMRCCCCCWCGLRSRRPVMLVCVCVCARATHASVAVSALAGSGLRFRDASAHSMPGTSMAASAVAEAVAAEQRDRRWPRYRRRPL